MRYHLMHSVLSQWQLWMKCIVSFKRRRICQHWNFNWMIWMSESMNRLYWCAVIVVLSSIIFVFCFLDADIRAYSTGFMKGKFAWKFAKPFRILSSFSFLLFYIFIAPQKIFKIWISTRNEDTYFERKCCGAIKT